MTDSEKALCRELGIEVTPDGFKQANKIASNLEYAGFDIYVGKDGSVFEKVGQELVEVTSPELEAEKRFLASSGYLYPSTH